ncbi:MAG TPA: hypothetical protein VMI53_03715 [Opitutaceae bacterium]|nr:hypothetical protein [Opitutaceae bacterium]
MKSPAAKDERLLRRLMDNTEESAAAALFMQLYRQSPPLRQWLREDYARDIKVRDKFDRLAAKEVPVSRFAELTEDNRAWRKEQTRLKKQMPANIYGGLTWNEVVRLVHHYQAGRLDLGAFLFVRQWRKAKKSSPSLMWSGLALLESVLPSGRRRLLRHLNVALAFVKKYENKAQRRSTVGYSDWWKLNTLIYILRHPRESYTTRELRAFLKTLGLKVGNLDIRRFCNRHGIRRDTLPGRPRRRGTVAKAAPRSRAGAGH